MSQGSNGTQPAVQKAFFYGYIVVTSAFLIIVVRSVAFTMYGVFFDPLISEFGWSRTVLSGASAVMNLVFGFACVLSARLCEKFRPEIVVGVSSAILGLGYFLMSQIQSEWQLYLSFGVVIPVGISIHIAAMTIILRWFYKRRGLMTGVVLSGQGLAAVAGAPLSSWLIYAYGWREAFLVLGIFSFIVMGAASFFLRRDPRQMGQLPYGATGAKDEVPASSGLSLREAVRTRQFWLIATMYFVFVFCSMTFMVHIVIHGIGLGMTAAAAAMVVTVYGVFFVATSTVGGMSGDRLGNRVSLVIGFALFAVSFFWLAAASDAWQLYLIAIVIGLAHGTMQALLSPLVAEVFGLKAHGSILGGTAFAGAMGAIVGPFLAGYMFDHTGSYSLPFAVCGILAVAALAMAPLTRPLRPGAPK